MKRRSQLASLGAVLLLVGCSGTPKTDQANSPTAPVNPSAAQPSQPSSSSGFSRPVVTSTGVAQVAAVPGLLKPTNAKMRVPSITTGRSDPFAQVMTGPIPVAAVKITPAAPRRKSGTSKQPPLQLTPLPKAPTPNSVPPSQIARSPDFLPLPVTSPPNLSTLPPVSIPVAPPSPTALADAIEITGAIQIQNKWHVIVKEPDSTSRYVTAGDYLANGRVLVKKVIAGAGSDPVVVLQQNGKEVTRSLGATKSSSTG